ncbi:MAG TPA: SigB/SigF/SigG family RNA polymerase sigma factor [Firmicutes bacterium]|nr:SigB/SigF/SigG family RNA polymerase sigma factor [Bacillota bacterium]
MEELIKMALPPADLSPEETRLLIRRAQKGDLAARDRLIKSNLRLVMSLVQRFSRRGAEADDLFQVGCLGLVSAIEHFNLEYEVRFSTYAVPRILGEIKRFLQKEAVVKVSRHWHDLAGKAAASRERLTQELGRSPTVTEVALDIGVRREDVVYAMEAVAQPVSVEEIVFQDEGAPLKLGDQIAIESEDAAVVDNLALRQVLSSLPEEERQLVEMRFIRNMRQVDVARAFGVSQAHVSRLEQRVLLKMRSLMS